MSVHDAVSCDVCMNSSFSGNRYKCLICYDYDLCANCYEAGATSGQHLTQHPMQCVLAKADYDLYYAGEESSKSYVPRSFTCPFCGQMGHSDSTLNTHVSNEHSEDSFEVVCPICAATPGGDPNRVTEDFIGHLMMEHRVSGRDFNEIQAVSTNTSTEPQTSHNSTGTGIGRLQSETHQYHSSGSTGSSLSSSGGHESEAIESMSELLYQLSALKGRSSTIQSISTQLQQLELQLQSTRHQLEILPFKSQSHQATSRQHRQQQNPGDGAQVVILNHSGNFGSGFAGTSNANQEPKAKMRSSFLLSRDDDILVPEEEQEKAESESANKALFVQELLTISLVEDLTLNNGTPCDETAALPEAAELQRSACNPLLPTPGHMSKSNCDRKPVPSACKEFFTRDNNTLALGGVITSHQSLDKVEAHQPKIRLHLPQKVSKHKNGKEMLPPKK